MVEPLDDFLSKLEGLIESLGTVDLEEEDLARQFIESKYLTVALHAHTQASEIKSLGSNKKVQLEFGKQLKLYLDIEELLRPKCSELSLIEMHDRLKKCLAISKLAA